MTWMLLIITFAVVLTMALSIRRAAEEAHDALCGCLVTADEELATIIPFPAPTQVAASA